MAYKKSNHPAPDHGATIAQYLVDMIDGGLSGKWEFSWNKIMSSDNMNYSSNTGYSMLNNMYLNSAIAANGFTCNLWLTGKQAMDKKWNIKGKKSVAWVMKPNIYNKTDKDGNKLIDSNGNNVMGYSFGKPKYAALFNCEQFEEYTPKVEKVLVQKFTDDSAAETFISNLDADILHRGNRAFYSIGSDGITLPPKTAFKAVGDSTALEGYYGTAFHELTHWTGAKERLNRDIKNSFGTEKYAYEELVAEIGAAMLCQQLGISETPRADHAKYIKSWLGGIKNNPNAIMQAASLANQAVGYMNKKQPTSVKNDNTSLKLAA